MSETLVSKSEFAARVNISPGRVSQLISEGKITREAIDGEGRSAKLYLERALAQYRATRSIGQALGNGAHARTYIADAPALPTAPSLLESPKAERQIVLPDVDPVADRIQRERLEQERIKTERMRREEAMAEGRYMLADEAVAQLNQVAATITRVFEGGLTDIATAISARFELPQRDVFHELQKAFREVRARASQEHREQAEELSELIDETEPEASEV